MKSMALVALGCLLLSSCGFLAQQYVEEAEYAVPAVESIPAAIMWIEKNVKYQSDLDQYDYSDYWASPGETMVSLKGDCEDMALLFLYMVYANFGEKGTLEVLRNKEGTKAHAVGTAGDYRFYDVEDFTQLRYSLLYEDAMSRIGQKNSKALNDGDYMDVD